MRLVKEIKSKRGVLHFRRYAIFETQFISLYLHEIYKEDKDPYLHNHPWKLFSWILWGSYIEELTYVEPIDLMYDASSGKLDLGITDEVTRTAGHFAYRGSNAFHKIKKLLTPVVLTLALCIGKRQPWYYLTEEGFVSNEDFRAKKLGSYKITDLER